MSTNFDDIFRTFSRIRLDLIIALKPPERVFRVHFTLFEHILLGMHRDILKEPTLYEAKNRNKPRVLSHLVTSIPHTGE